MSDRRKLKLKCVNPNCIMQGKIRWIKNDSLNEFLCHCGFKLTHYGGDKLEDRRIKTAKDELRRYEHGV